MIRVPHFFLLCFFLTSSIYTTTNEFIAKKKAPDVQRKQSAAHIREEICESLLCSSQEISSMHIELAQFDTDLKDLMHEIVDDDFLGSCNKKQLNSGKQQIEIMRQEIQDMRTKIKNAQRQYQTLHTTLFPR
jgi:hypothetical protein